MNRLSKRMMAVRVVVPGEIFAAPAALSRCGWLLLIGLTALGLSGCSAEPAKTAAPPAAAGSPTAAAESSSATPAAAAGIADTASPEKSTSAQAGTGASSAGTSKAAAPAKKPPAAPSAAQLEKWGITKAAPLELLTCYDGFGDYPHCLAVTPDGKRFVLGGAKLTLWNTSESQPKIDLLEKYNESDVKRPILCVGISPDGEWLAAGDNAGKLRLWNMHDQSERKTIQAHDGRLTQLAISPDSKRLATTGYSGEVRVWQAADGSSIKNLKVDTQEIHRLEFLSDSLLACAGRETTLWNVESGEKTATLTTDRVIGPALGLSRDRRWLAFADGEGRTKFWDVEKQAATGAALHGAGPQWIDFSPDGRRIATYSGDSNIRIWDATNRNTLQVIDADGGRTTALRWLPETQALLVVSELGRVRLWGTPETAKSLGVEPLKPAELRAMAATERRSYSPAQFDKVIDVRSFPRLPNAISGWSFAGMESYNAPVAQAEAELFYRYLLGQSGWGEVDAVDPAAPGLNFRKEGCALNVSFAAPTPVPGQEVRAGDLQVNLRFAGNYDVRWLPKVSEIKSTSSFSSFSLVSYRAKAALTDIEIALLKKSHEAGWTVYTRLAASSTEDPTSRTLTMLQGGSELTVSIGPPADAPGELAVQTSVVVSRKSLPIPPDSGWIEFDSSTDLQMVANTSMNLKQTIDFYDREMALEGWLAREAGRHTDEKEQRVWLPYIRGQQDVLIRLAGLPDDKTRVIVGDAERSSWQLEKPRPADAATAQLGIEAADFQLPKGAAAVKFDIDQKQIEFEVAGATPPQLAEQFAKHMESLDWKRDGAGVLSDEYVLVTYKKGKAELQLRGRAAMKKSTAMISGDGLLWTKPLPTAPVRVSYETWLRRNRKSASLEHLDEFTEAMKQIPAGSGTAK